MYRSNYFLILFYEVLALCYFMVFFILLPFLHGEVHEATSV